MRCSVKIKEILTISIITSDYWVNKEDFPETEFEGIIHEFED